MTDHVTTQGPFIVDLMVSDLKYLAIRQAETREAIAVVVPKNDQPNYADAAMFALQLHTRLIVSLPFKKS